MKFKVINPDDNTSQTQQVFPWKMFLLTSAAGVAIGLIVGDIYRAVKDKSMNFIRPNPSIPPAPPPYYYPPQHHAASPPPQEDVMSREELLLWQRRLEHMQEEVLRKARHFNLIT